jgi:predicted AAA+ superfamily ATPase
MQTRYLKHAIEEDLPKKMLFIGGPRQVGKTTLARSLLKSSSHYLNWDVPADRDKILRGELPSAKRIAFDEIHKYRSWRNFLKGVFDGSRDSQTQILVTGSARLDFYRRGGDSLQGRYFFHRLHPLSIAELRDEKALADLLRLGGFPEPFFSGTDRDAKRWSLDYRHRLIREDLTSLERFEDLGNIELLLMRMPELVGSPLSLNALREDLQVSHHSVRRWLDALERLYAFFRISPFGPPKIRAVKKEQKHYHFDWTLVKSDAARFENLVASGLLKWCHYERDVNGRELELRYFRDVTGREVDFVIMEGKTPLQFIECKMSDESVDPSLRYLKGKFPGVEAVQIVAKGKKNFISPDGIRVLPAGKFLATLV